MCVFGVVLCIDFVVCDGVCDVCVLCMLLLCLGWCFVLCCFVVLCWLCYGACFFDGVLLLI